MENKKAAEYVHLKWYGIPAIKRFLKPYRGLLITLVLCMGTGSAVEAAFPLFQRYAISHFIGEGTLDTLVPYILAYMGLLIFETLLNGFGCYVSCKAEVLVDEDIRQACFDHIQTMSFSFFNQNSVGHIHSRIISDPDRIGFIISWGLMDLVLNIVYLISIFIIMFVMNPLLGFLLLLVVPLEFFVTNFLQNRLSDATRSVREIGARITGNYNEGITGVRTIKSLVVEDRILEDFQKDTAEMHMASVRAGRYRALLESGITFLSSTALALILWRGGVLTKQGLILVGSLSVFMSYAISIGFYVSELVKTLARLINTQASIERVEKLLTTPSDVKDSPEVIEKYGDSFHPKKENWEPLHGHITFEDVSFRYPDGEEEILEHFDLDVPQGSMVAIVGATGAGKSTLVNLVCRFYEPTEGRVLIDGRDARERSQLWLHSHIGYVLQTPHLFSGSVLENLRYGNPNASMEEIRTACERVCADRVIERMEKGYDSEVGEGGELLSTGEKQLLSFARAILADPRILVLDEATSSVDTLTEKTIQDAIRTVTEGRTSFVIAHRLSTIRNADRILVMKNGKVVEQGTHEELLAKKGYYAKLYHTQLMNLDTQEVLYREKRQKKPFPGGIDTTTS